MHNISLTVEGYLSQYLEIAPKTIKKIIPGQSKVFIVTITSPTYMKQGSYPLDFTITGRLEGKKTMVQSDNTTVTILTNIIYSFPLIYFNFYPPMGLIC